MSVRAKGQRGFWAAWACLHAIPGAGAARTVFNLLGRSLAAPGEVIVDASHSGTTRGAPWGREKGPG